MKIRKGLKELNELNPNCQSIRTAERKDFRIIDTWDRIEPDRNVIYWHIHSFSPDLDQNDLIGAVRLGFDTWGNVFKNAGIDIAFQSTSDKSLAQINCYFSENGDSNLPYTFESGVLAYALNDGRIFFNDDWNWTLALDPAGIKFVDVHVHEIGHQLLLDHTDAHLDIMQPYIDPTGQNYITNDSIDGVKTVYSEFIKPTEDDPRQPVTDEQCQAALKVFIESGSFNRLPKKTYRAIVSALGESEPFWGALVELLLSRSTKKNYIMNLTKKVMIEMLEKLGYEYNSKFTKKDLFTLFHKALNVELK